MDARSVSHDSAMKAERKDKSPAEAGNQPDGAMRVPVVAEELEVATTLRDTGGVRISKTVTESVETVEEPLVRHEVVIDRVAINRVVDGSEAPAIRQEGDTTIIPVLEEVLVVEKRLMLKEEVHVKRVARETRSPERVTVRKEQATVERVD
jgi:uncharacterized protein (TIGR02271 family)